MVAPAIAAAGVSGLFGLFGASKSQKAQEAANEANRPVNQVAEWVEAGINPIVGITQGNYIPHQASFAMGDAFANAGSRLADGINLKHDRELAETELSQENEALREALADMRSPYQPSNMDRYGGQLPDVPTVGDGDIIDMRAGEGYTVLTPDHERSVPRLGPSVDGRPQSRPTSVDVVRRRVYLPNGEERWIPATVAERNGVRQNQHLAPGEYTEITGELRGEAESALFANQIGEEMGIPLMGDSNFIPSLTTVWTDPNPDVPALEAESENILDRTFDLSNDEQFFRN